jgi:hypothetical protein
MYWKRPNGFKGSGLNDVTWGTGATNAATAYYEVVIDLAAATDTFKWRKNGGAWTEDVALTGAAQTLDEGQQITFAATAGHTAGDQWVIGNLVSGATTESGTTAQITTAGNRMLNPDAPPTFTDSGGKTVLWIDYASGTAHFNGNVATVTVSGNNGYIPAGSLQYAAYCQGWNASFTLDMADITAQGDKWKTNLPGIPGGSGSIDKMFIGGGALLDEIAETLAGGDKYALFQLFTWDADKDQTGDHLQLWAAINGLGVNPTVGGGSVKESVNFTLTGLPYWVANT